MRFTSCLVTISSPYPFRLLPGLGYPGRHQVLRRDYLGPVVAVIAAGELVGNGLALRRGKLAPGQVFQRLPIPFFDEDGQHHVPHL